MAACVIACSEPQMPGLDSPRIEMLNGLNKKAIVILQASEIDYHARIPSTQAFEFQTGVG